MKTLAEITTHSVQTPSGRIAYAEAGSGPIALFVHGVLLNKYLWRHQMVDLADIRRVIAVDLLAHGDTDIAPDQDVSVTANAKMLREFLDALKIDTVDLIGNDSGGGISQIFAANNPERIRTLTLTECDVHNDWMPEAFNPFVEMTKAGGLATGGGIAKRKLYTDDELHISFLCCAFIINGIGEFAHRPDLLERAILVSLASMPEGSRRTERSIFDEFKQFLPGCLGALYDIVAEALRNEDKVEPPANIRMADAAAWIRSAEPATGLPEGTLLTAVEQSQINSVIDRILENPLVIALEAVIASGPFVGRVGDLFESVISRVDRPDRAFPRTAAHLSNQLQRLRPAMEKAGIFVKLERKSRDGRHVSVWRDGQDPNNAGPDPFRKMK